MTPKSSRIPGLRLKARRLSQAGSRFLHLFWKQEEGQDLIEYTLLIASIALAATGLMSGVRHDANGIFSTMNSTLSSAAIAAS